MLDSLTDNLSPANAETVLGIEKYIRAVKLSESDTVTTSKTIESVFTLIGHTIEYIHESGAFVNAVPLLDTFRFTDKQWLSVGSMSWKIYPYWKRLSCSTIL